MNKRPVPNTADQAMTAIASWETTIKSLHEGTAKALAMESGKPRKNALIAQQKKLGEIAELKRKARALCSKAIKADPTLIDLVANDKQPGSIWADVLKLSKAKCGKVNYATAIKNALSEQRKPQEEKASNEAADYAVMKMELRQVTVAEFAGELHSSIVIPPYQRRYIVKEDWQRNLVESAVNQHPIGVLTVFKDKHDKKLGDGQQRATTLVNRYNLPGNMSGEDFAKLSAYRLMIVEYSMADGSAVPLNLQQKIFDDMQRGNPLSLGERLPGMKGLEWNSRAEIVVGGDAYKDHCLTLKSDRKQDIQLYGLVQAVGYGQWLSFENEESFIRDNVATSEDMDAVQEQFAATEMAWLIANELGSIAFQTKGKNDKPTFNRWLASAVIGSIVKAITENTDGKVFCDEIFVTKAKEGLRTLLGNDRFRMTIEKYDGEEIQPGNPAGFKRRMSMVSEVINAAFSAQMDAVIKQEEAVAA